MGDATTTLNAFVAEQVAGIAQLVRRRHEALLAAFTIKTTHGFSTSLRRLLAADQVIRLLYGDKLLRKRKRTIRPLRKSLGRLRDAQEVQGKFDELSLPGKAAEAFRKHLAAEEKVAAGAFQKELKEFDFAPIERLTQAKAVRAMLSPEPCVPVEVLRADLLGQVLSLKPRAVEGGDDVLLHTMRVRYKYYRYALELLSPDITGYDEERLKYLKTLQDALGEAHDYVVLEEELAAFLEGRDLAGAGDALAAVRHRSVEVHDEARNYVKRELEELAALEGLACA